MDSDLFDDIFSDNAVKNARAGSKFQPKAKPRPLKRNSTSPLAPASQQIQTTDLSANRFAESCEAKGPSEPDGHISSGIVNASSDHADTTENVNSTVDVGPGVSIFVPDSNEDWRSCFEKSVGESADIFIGLESLGDFLPDSSGVLDNTVPSSEAPAVHVPGSSNTEGPTDPLVPAVDGSTCILNVSSTSSQPEISAAHVPLAGCEAIVSTSHGGCPTDNRDLETEELESYPGWETLDMSELTNKPGRRIGKFPPKPKLQSERSQNNISDLDLIHPVPTVPSQQDLQSVPPEVNFVDEGSVPALIHDGILDFASIGHSGPSAESASKVVVDAEETSPNEPSHPGAEIAGEHLESVSELPGKLASRRAKTGKSGTTASDLSPKQPASNQTEIAGRSLRKRQNKNLYQHRDESGDEAVADGDLPSKSPSISTANGNDSDDQEIQQGNWSQTKRVQKSKKIPGDKEKPVRKRKKDNETSDQAAKAAPKKFSHSTWRRRVNKTLLETPEDEIDFQKVPLWDLILLAEYKERVAKKEAAASQAPPPNQSAGNFVEPHNEDGDRDAFQGYYDEEPFASEQGGEANDEESSPRVQENSEYFNYQTYMDKTPIARWSKQDTELFYEAVRQFGTDPSMIQQLFPGRTRRQIKLKYKKEERQHPLRLRDALTNRSKDHSHFELVIDRLRQLAEEEKLNSNKADSVDLTGEEEVEEGTPETNDNEGKSEQIDEDMMEKAEPDYNQVQSPVKTYDSEDDSLIWSQYKSED